MAEDGGQRETRVPYVLRSAGWLAAVPARMPQLVGGAAGAAPRITRTLGAAAGSAVGAAFRTVRSAHAVMSDHPGEDKRRVWHRQGRAHVGLAPIREERFPEFASEVSSTVAALLGVNWAELVPFVSRLVVDFDPETVALDQVLEAVQAVEERYETDPDPAATAEHPADVEPLYRQGITLVGDAVGLAVSLAVTATSPLREVATAAAILEGMPPLRRLVESRLGVRGADVALSLTAAVAQTLAERPLGLAVDIGHRGLLLTEALARRRAWLSREPELFNGRSHPLHAASRPPRPTPLPAGPIESYSGRAWPVSLGGMAMTVGATRSFERAAGALSAGIPRAARLGREAFAVTVAWRLASRRVIVLDPRALRLLDRVDTLVLESELADADALELLESAREAGLEAMLAGDLVESVEPGDLGGSLPAVPEAILRLQEEGRVVCFVGRGGSPGLAHADFALGMDVAGHATPWEAHVLGTDRLAEVALIAESCRVARHVSRQSVLVAMAGSGAASVLALGSLPGSGDRVAIALNTAAAIGLINGLRAGAWRWWDRRPMNGGPTGEAGPADDVG